MLKPVFTAIALSLLSASGCASGPAKHSAFPGADTMGVRAALRTALQRAAPAYAGQIADLDPGRLRVSVDTSQVVPGLRYHRTVYAPPGTADIVVHAVVGSLGDRVAALERPADWAGLVASSGWRPGSPEAAVRACGELVGTTGPRSGGVWPPAMYLGPGSLQTPGLHLHASARDALQPPRTSRSASAGWEVIAWFLESGRIARYVCTFEDDATGYVITTAIEGVGLPLLGP